MKKEKLKLIVTTELIIDLPHQDSKEATETMSRYIREQLVELWKKFPKVEYTKLKDVKVSLTY